MRRWREVAPRGELHGGRYGLAALKTGEWLLLSQMHPDWLSSVDASPGMALGGGRDRLDDQELDRAVALLAARGIDTLFLIGGNGTMAAGRELAARAAHGGVPLRTVGIPKTIDNDIPDTDVAPGFASAARFLIETVRDVTADISSMGRYEDVVLIEAMGRHSGWLAAATLLARTNPGDAPHVVFVPEQPLASGAFLNAIREQHAPTGLCVAVVSEGVRDQQGRFFAELGADCAIEHDGSGQVILGRSGGPLPVLARLVRSELGLRCRSVRPDVLQRCSRAHVVGWDREIAAMVGRAATDWAAAARPGEAVMIALRRTSGRWNTEAVPLELVRGERWLPASLQADPTPLRFLLS